MEAYLLFYSEHIKKLGNMLKTQSYSKYCKVTSTQRANKYMKGQHKT